jgi:hypothetical protein
MSDHNLGEDAYRAYLANIKPTLECPCKWHALAPEDQRVWEKVAAAVVLRMLLDNLAEPHRPLPLPPFALPEDTITPIMEEIGRKTGKERGLCVQCGGSCFLVARYVRCAYRSARDLGSRFESRGFRPVIKGRTTTLSPDVPAPPSCTRP